MESSIAYATGKPRFFRLFSFSRGMILASNCIAASLLFGPAIWGFVAWKLRNNLNDGTLGPFTESCFPYLDVYPIHFMVAMAGIGLTLGLLGALSDLKYSLNRWALAAIVGNFTVCICNLLTYRM